MSNLLANKALLASLNIRQWSGRKLDKQATSTVENAYATKGKVGNYTKKLLPNCKQLDDVTASVSALRQFFYDQTLPWAVDGQRILASKNYIPYVTGYRVLKCQFDTAVETFKRDYPMLRDNARNTLADLYREGEYPSASAIGDAFGCDMAFMPMPTVDDFRVQILDEEKQAFIERMQSIEKTAMRDCWQRLYDVVAKASGKLHEEGAVFRDSLIENITELCALLPKLNVTDDAKLEQMRQEVESLANGLSIDNLRKVTADRNAAAEKLEAVASKMSAFMV